MLRSKIVEGPTGLDPHWSNRNVAWSVLSTFYDGLVGFTPGLAIEPALAESWRQSDATHWRFELRRGVRFHDGTALDAADVVASIERARTHRRSSVAYHLHGVGAVRADGEHAVTIETFGPVPDLLNRLTFVLVVPSERAGNDAIVPPAGTGPYRYVTTAANGAVLARAWNGWRGRPPIAEVRFEFLGSDQRAAEGLLAGTVDVCHLLPDDWFGRVDAAPQLRRVEQPRLAVQVLGIHPEFATGAARTALQDRRVRVAMLRGLDRASWVRRVFRGNGTVASQYVHPAVFGFDPELLPLPYDPAGARQALADAGFADGFDTVLSPGRASPELVDEIVDGLGRIGIRVHLAAAGEPSPLVYFAWACSTGDASDFFNTPLWRQDAPGHSSDEALAAEQRIAVQVAAADRETDPALRRALLQEIQRQVLAEMPLLPLTVRWGYKGISERVEVVTRFDERESVALFRWRS